MLHPKQPLACVLILSLILPVSVMPGIAVADGTAPPSATSWTGRLTTDVKLFRTMEAELNSLINEAGPRCSSHFVASVCPNTYRESPQQSVSQTLANIKKADKLLYSAAGAAQKADAPVSAAAKNSTDICNGGTAIASDTAARKIPLNEIKTALEEARNLLDTEYGNVFGTSSADSAAFQQKAATCANEVSSFSSLGSGCLPKTKYDGLKMVFEKGTSYMCGLSGGSCTGNEVQKFYEYAGQTGSGKDGNLVAARKLLNADMEAVNQQISNVATYVPKAASSTNCKSLNDGKAGAAAPGAPESKVSSASPKIPPAVGAAAQATLDPSFTDGKFQTNLDPKAAAASVGTIGGSGAGTGAAAGIYSGLGNGGTATTSAGPSATMASGAVGGSALTMQASLDPAATPWQDGAPVKLAVPDGSLGTPTAAPATTAADTATVTPKVAPAPDTTQTPDTTTKLGGLPPPDPTPKLGGLPPPDPVVPGPVVNNVPAAVPATGLGLDGNGAMIGLGLLVVGGGAAAAIALTSHGGSSSSGAWVGSSAASTGTSVSTGVTTSTITNTSTGTSSGTSTGTNTSSSTTTSTSTTSVTNTDTTTYSNTGVTTITSVYSSGGGSNSGSGGVISLPVSAGNRTH